MAGIYIHIPFCKQACSYCDFHFSTSLNQKDMLLQSLYSEIEQKHQMLAGYQIDTIYLGGGTPTLLSVSEMSMIFDKLDKHFDLRQLKEVTIEANPDDLTREYLHALKHHTPINRLSIGIQSFFDEDLRHMNRAHTGDVAIEGIHQAIDARFNSINVDLIFGLPWRESTDYLQYNLKQYIDLGIQHISCYQLTIEPKTLLSHQIKKGILIETPEDRMVEEFYLCENTLLSAGYEHYEISNYALDGHIALHNTNYWFGLPYLGLGPSAHSFIDHTRYQNIANNSKYIRHKHHHRSMWIIEPLSIENQWNEMVMTGLRTKWGIRRSALLDLLPHKANFLDATLEALIDDGYIRQDKPHIFTLSTKGKIVCDAVALALFVESED